MKNGAHASVGDSRRRTRTRAAMGSSASCPWGGSSPMYVRMEWGWSEWYFAVVWRVRMRWGGYTRCLFYCCFGLYVCRHVCALSTMCVPIPFALRTLRLPAPKGSMWRKGKHAKHTQTCKHIPTGTLIHTNTFKRMRITSPPP